MKTHFIEVTNNSQNWGKFVLIRFEENEFSYKSCIAAKIRLLPGIGWHPSDIIVFDLQTCEGAAFSARPHASVKADLAKHQIWVCPMYEPFLEWLYQQDLTDLDKLPAFVNLPDVEFALAGYRRKGKSA